MTNSTNFAKYRLVRYFVLRSFARTVDNSGGCKLAVKFQYRILTWRDDVRTRTHSTPEFEGDTIEECDQKARDHYRLVSRQPENQWNKMSIHRIDAPAVPELTSLIETNDTKEGGDHQL